jgi:hypothetical protein
MATAAECDLPRQTGSLTLTTNRPRLPTVAETLLHQAYSDTVWQFEPTRRGKLPVAKGRGGPIKIAWEVHGHGPIQVVVSP